MTPNNSKYYVLTIKKITKWINGQLHSFTTDRPKDFKFKAGQFARLGLPIQILRNQDPTNQNLSDHYSNPQEPTIWRGFSMVNPEVSDYLEFYATLVPTGEFSPKLFSLDEGDNIAIHPMPIGFLTLDNFPNGGDTLWLLATGTGLSAFLSIIFTSNTWNLFKNIVLVHGVRHGAELSYQDALSEVNKDYTGRFTYMPVPTREKGYIHPWTGNIMPSERITSLLESDKLSELSGLDMNPHSSCIMLCGNPNMLSEARVILGERGFATGRRGAIGNLAVEKYW